MFSGLGVSRSSLHGGLTNDEAQELRVENEQILTNNSAGSTLMFIPIGRVLVAAVMAFVLGFGPALASERGKVTNLPLPRFVSMKAAEGNVRRGPSLTHRIDWVFQRRDMPLQVTAEHGHWRRVEDRDGVGGWVHYSLLSGTRTVLVEKDMLQLHARPSVQAPINAALELGVVARVAKCGADWCLLRGHPVAKLAVR